MNISSLKNIQAEVKTITFNNEEIQVKTRISEGTKIKIADIIKTFYFTENGVESTDFQLTCKDIYNAVFVNCLIDNYTDIISDDELSYIEICDAVVLSGLYETILGVISPLDIAMLKDMIDRAINEQNRVMVLENSVENQLKKALDKVIEMIPSEGKIKSLLKVVKSEFKNFDINKLKFINDKNLEFGEKGLPDLNNIVDIGEKILENMKVKKSK
jgi:hypothetical protein